MPIYRMVRNNTIVPEKRGKYYLHTGRLLAMRTSSNAKEAGLFWVYPKEFFYGISVRGSLLEYRSVITSTYSKGTLPKQAQIPTDWYIDKFAELAKRISDSRSGLRWQVLSHIYDIADSPAAILNGHWIEVRLSRVNLALMVGGTREAVGRVVLYLIRHGYLREGRNKFYVKVPTLRDQRASIDDIDGSWNMLPEAAAERRQRSGSADRERLLKAGRRKIELLNASKQRSL